MFALFSQRSLSVLSIELFVQRYYHCSSAVFEFVDDQIFYTDALILFSFSDATSSRLCRSFKGLIYHSSTDDKDFFVFVKLP